MTRFGDWIGRSEEATEMIAAAPVRRLAATLDLPAVDPVSGDALPPMWHWLYFLPDAARRELGPDGHLQRGAFYPPVPLRRRMFSGGRVTMHRALQVGETASRTRTIESIEEKEGSTGPLVLVKVRHDIIGESGPALTEFQTIVYTDATPRPPGDGGEPPDAPWRRDVTTDPVLLFRFSALTFNSHRIHYDRDFATSVDGYPSLVVHGPLTALLLAELARANRIDVAEFSFRALAPVYSGDVIALRGWPEGDGGRLEAYRHGELAVEARVAGPLAQSS